jgi:hypothetical protein
VEQNFYAKKAMPFAAMAHLQMKDCHNNNNNNNNNNNKVF